MNKNLIYITVFVLLTLLLLNYFQVANPESSPITIIDKSPSHKLSKDKQWGICWIAGPNPVNEEDFVPIDIFCIGTELHATVQQRQDNWIWFGIRADG